MRLKLSSLLAAVSLLCGPAFAAPALPDRADIRDSGFVYCVSGQVNTFNPQKVSSGLIVDTLAAQIYDRLLDVDPYTYRLVPELAESWEVLDNGATYRFHLRRHVPFQRTAWFTPTRDFNADDVIFTFGRIFNRDHPWHNVNGSSFPYFDSLQFADSVESVRKLDNQTVEFRLKRPDASFLWHLATHYASITSAEYAARLTQDDRQEQLDRQPVGTGPFQLSDYRSGQYVRLQRHPGYWRGKPLMPQVVVDLGSGGTGRLSKLLTGEEAVVYGDSGYLGAGKREDAIVRNKSGHKIKYKINRRPSQVKKLSKSGQYAARKAEHVKSSVRAKAEHVFGVVKKQLRFRKTRYRGLEKQQAKFNILFALANLILADRPCLAA